jgi:PKD domain
MRGASGAPTVHASMARLAEHRMPARGAALAALAIVLLACLGLTPGAADAAETLYWANSGTPDSVGFAALDGSGLGGSLKASAASHTDARGLSIDLEQGRGYFGGEKHISYVDLDGGPGGDLPLAGLSIGNVRSVAVDPAAGVLYFTETSPVEMIGYARLDGSGGGFLPTGAATVHYPIGIAVDPVLGRVYWINTLGDSLSYANLDGSGGGDIVSGGEPAFHNPQGLAIDPVGERAYWTNVYGQTIYSEALSGLGGPVALNLSGGLPSNPAGLAIDPERRRLYWGNVTETRVSFANLDGSGGGKVATGTAEVNGASYPDLVKPPVSAAAPRISPDGGALDCSTGAWEPDWAEAFSYRSPSAYAYSWARDGAAIAGAAGATYTPTASGAYECTVTASNPAGAASATSPGVRFDLPPSDSSQSGTAATATTQAAAPRLAGLRVSPHSVVERRARGARAGSRPPGATVRFHLDEPASVTFTIAAARRGGRGGVVVGGGRGTISRPGKAGRNTFHFSGRLHGKALAPGPYLLSATPTAGGLAGATSTASFRIDRIAGRSRRTS